MKLRPFEDRVIIKQTEASKEADGVLVPDQAQVAPAEGVVVAVGPGVVRGDTLYLSAIYKILRWAIGWWWKLNLQTHDQAREEVPDPASDYSPMQVRVGDYVVFGKYAGTKIKFNGEDYMMVRQSDCFMCDEEKTELLKNP